MLRHRRLSGSDVPVRLLYSSRTLDDVIYRAELDEPADGVEVVVHAHARAARGLDGVHAAGRRGAARGGRVARGRGAARLRLRADELRRDRRGRAGRAGLSARPREDGALRSDGTLMEALDGNAIGGLLIELFGRELTDRGGRVRALRRRGARWRSSSSTSRRRVSSGAAGAATASCSWSSRPTACAASTSAASPRSRRARRGRPRAAVPPRPSRPCPRRSGGRSGSRARAAALRRSPSCRRSRSEQ